MRCDHPDWVHNRLTVTGSVERARAFRQAARGCGAVPWVIDYDQVQEDTPALLLRPPPAERRIGLEAARALARELRDFVQDGTEQVHAAAGVSTACAFDLHSLVPVPWRILRLGPDHLDSLAWLWPHWGTTWTPRRARELAVPSAEAAALPVGTARLRYGFWTADWAPWPALQQIRQGWPAMQFRLACATAWPDLVANRPKGAAQEKTGNLAGITAAVPW
jgi:hypothetical protein